jgi:hypothetical protein
MSRKRSKAFKSVQKRTRKRKVIGKWIQPISTICWRIGSRDDQVCKIDSLRK